LFWPSRLKKTLRREVEKEELIVSPKQIKWCSAEASKRHDRDKIGLKKYYENIILVSNDGRRILASEIFDEEKRDRKRHAELLARSAGLQKLAIEDGRIAPVLITITMPSEHHPLTSYGKKRVLNPNYEDHMPSETHATAQQAWARARARFLKHDLMPYFVKAAQPHKTGTPHYHVVGWVRDEGEAIEVESILREAYSNNSRTGIQVDALEGADGGIKYISRVLSYISRSTVADSKEEEEAERTKEWSKIWNIRRFTTSHSRATIWRMLRSADIDASGTHAEQAQLYANAGNFAGFIEAVKISEIKIAYIDLESKYGEVSKKAIGIKVGNITLVKQRAWELKTKVELIEASIQAVTVVHIDQGPAAKNPKTAFFGKKDANIHKKLSHGPPDFGDSDEIRLG
jgi:hypothetical protein